MRVPFAEVTPQQHSRETDFITSNIQHRSSYFTQLIPSFHFFSSSVEGFSGDFSAIQKPDSYVENQWIFPRAALSDFLTFLYFPPLARLNSGLDLPECLYDFSHKGRKGRSPRSSRWLKKREKSSFKIRAKKSEPCSRTWLTTSGYGLSDDTVLF